MSSPGSRTTDVRGRLTDIWRAAADRALPLPTELELAKELGVSRSVVREALVDLEAQGLVARRAHQGTFPNVAALSVPFRIDQSYELTSRLEAVGFDVEVHVVAADWSSLSPQEAADLNATAGSSCFRVVKRWLGNGRPLITAEDVVPARRREIEFDPEYSVFDTVQQLRGEWVEWESATLAPVLPDEQARELLDAPRRQPLLAITIVGVSLHGDRLYRAHEVHTTHGVRYGMVRRALPND
ncbi:hypothetical protein BHE97_03505 [Aeromicrobium sp. PE09-221]|uniref:GntR family transcriptional regulator n=1 Tax=Aeromicrobium sp. PE09-221 TaxID=1898043 RepID=UPI000B3EACAD|nr:GntR family transcriptional regulator [Aeromicrobium sp. PE09-221]OUZ11954.1 hypothetical protein BHE97_03505 [Aeromicrobium sp. PE09-221]